MKTQQNDLVGSPHNTTDKLDLGEGLHRSPDTLTRTGSAPSKAYGEYHENGYNVFVNNSLIYTAGNSPWDSQCSVQDSDFALPLKTMRRYCISTTKEIAAEHRAQYCGVERIAQPHI